MGLLPSLRESGQTLAEACGLIKNFNGTRALNGLSLSVAKGEVVGLLGPNGSGKTTAIHIFLGLLEADAGSVTVLGSSPLTERSRIAPRINFSSAYVQLPSNLKVIENLRLFARLYSVPAAGRKIDEILSLFEMGALTERVTGALSSGERTRLNLCKALLNDPILLLMDEPTASLDPEIAHSVRKILMKIHRERGIGMLYTSHNMKEVEEICDRILLIDHGSVVAEGTCAELLASHQCRDMEEVFLKVVGSARRVR